MVWDPWMWRQASELLEQAERIQRSFLQAALGGLQASVDQRARWSPAVNVVETDEDLWVIFALPGVAADRIELRLEGGALIVSGHRPLPECFSDGELKVLEIPCGRFERRLQLPPGISLSLGEVRRREGLLFVQLRKS
ncbi:MAG TPA: Hsp20/alpha crystallin family protein [Candidatus Binatia bacterium]